jgi:hypothetical protein
MEPVPRRAEPGVLPPPGPSAEILAMEALGKEITELCAHIHAATYRLLCLIGEFDRREGWAEGGGGGVLSCAHWLNWKCGIALGAAREKVRVARALGDLPLISEAFRKGEISYSKVRAMTRVADAENEEYLLMIAHHGTASHMERLVRACRQVKAVQALEEANQRYQERYLTWYYDEDGSFVIKGRLPPEDGARVQKAVQAIVDEEDKRWWADWRARRDRSEAEDVSAETSGESATSSDRDVSAETSAEGVSREAELSEAVRQREPAAARRADALTLMAESLLERGPATGTGGDRYQIVLHVEAEGLADPASGGRSAIEDGPAVPGETARRLACDASLVRMLVDGEGEPLNVGRKTRTIPPAIRRAVKTRDGGCRYPGCTALHFVDAHHVKHWADGGETRLSNLVQLCRRHHRLLHEGGYTVRVLDDGVLVFADVYGRPIDPAPQPHLRDPPGADSLVRANRASGLDIDAKTCTSLWDGLPMDLGMAVDGVLPPQRWKPRGPYLGRS